MIHNAKIASLAGALSLFSTPNLEAQQNLLPTPSIAKAKIDRTDTFEERYILQAEATIEAIESSIGHQLQESALEMVGGRKHFWVGEYPIKPQVLHTIPNPSNAIDVSTSAKPFLASNPGASLIFTAPATQFDALLQALSSNSALPAGTKAEVRIHDPFGRAVKTGSFGDAATSRPQGDVRPERLVVDCIIGPFGIGASATKSSHHTTRSQKQEGNLITRWDGEISHTDVIASDSVGQEMAPLIRHAVLSVDFYRTRIERGEREEVIPLPEPMGKIFKNPPRLTRRVPYENRISLPEVRVRAELSTHDIAATQSLIEQEHQRCVDGVLRKVISELPPSLGMERDIAFRLLKSIQLQTAGDAQEETQVLLFSSSSQLRNALSSLARGLKPEQYADFEQYLIGKMEDSPALEHGRREADLAAFRSVAYDSETKTPVASLSWEKLPFSVAIDEVIPYLLRTGLRDDLENLPR